MDLGSQTRLLPSSAEIVALARESGNPALSPKRDGRLRCLAESNSLRSLPFIDGVEYSADPRTNADLILMPGGPEPSAIAQLLQQISSPAPVILAQSEAIGARADLVLSDWSGSSLSAAILSVAPIMARVAELPRLPAGPDRAGIAALALAYTRNCSLAPVLRPDEPAVVFYPLLFGLANARATLEELAGAGMLRRRFFERLHVCHFCDSSRLHAREICVKCHSSHLLEQSLVHHYACGWQAVQSSFEVRNGYVCPKCRKELRHYGVDYDKPGKVMCCQSCGDTMSEPEVEFLCLDCLRFTSSEHASFRDWHSYDLLPDGIAALKSGRLPIGDFRHDAARGYTLRDFRLLVGYSVSAARRTGRPLSAARMTVDTTDLAEKVGPHGVPAVCELFRDIAVLNVREQDMAATLSDAVLLCMPDTDEAGAQIVVGRIHEAISVSVRPRLKIKVEIFFIPQIDQFLNAISL